MTVEINTEYKFIPKHIIENIKNITYQKNETQKQNGEKLITWKLKYKDQISKKKKIANIFSINCIKRRNGNISNY